MSCPLIYLCGSCVYLLCLILLCVMSSCVVDLLSDMSVVCKSSIASCVVCDILLLLHSLLYCLRHLSVCVRVM